MAVGKQQTIDGVGYRFKQALLSEGLSVIAEIKRRSPSAGDLRPDLNPASLARQYRRAGAVCLSVLTDGPRFGGSAADLQQARRAGKIPVLRKDFLTTPADIYETQAMGADALLLIVADIDSGCLRSLHQLALGLGLDVLTEVRNQLELEAAVAAGAYMIAVNQRSDPKSAQLTVDPSRALALSQSFDQFDRGIVKVAASGIGVAGGTGMGELAAAGYDAALIGEALVRARVPEAKLRSLLA